MQAENLTINKTHDINDLDSFYYDISQQQLSQQEIKELRDIYPIYGKVVPDNLSMVTPQLDEVANVMESFVYAEVVGEEIRYNKNISLGDPELDTKRAEKGLDGEYEFFEYTLRVITDTEGKYSEGEIITITSNEMFRGYKPELEDGMRIVVPVERENEGSTRHGYTVTGMYYVTEDGYALSAFDENTAAMARTTYSGIKVENLLKELAELKK